MNFSTGVFLINRDLRAVLAIYEPDAAHTKGKRTMFKTLDQTIEVGDFVIVPTDTRHGMTVVKVVETDVSVDFDDPTQITWVISKIDMAAHIETLAKEAEAIESLKRAEFAKRRRAVFNDLVATDSAEIKSLALYKNGAPVDPMPAASPTPRAPKSPER